MRLARPDAVLTLMLTVFVVTACSQFLFPLQIHHDPASYLEFARALLAGKVPYVDFSDLNPPLIIYLSAIPFVFAEATGMPVIIAFKLLVLAVSLASVTTIYWLIIKYAPDCKRLLAPFIITLPMFNLTASSDFGQREHLLVLLYLPFLLLRWLRYRGEAPSGWVSALIGICAAIGICLKPPYVLAAVGAELVMAQMDRKSFLANLKAPEVVAGVLFAVLYAAHFLLLPIEARSAFFDYIIPLVLSGYASLNQPWYSSISVFPLGLYVLASVLCLVAVRTADCPQAVAKLANAINVFGGLSAVVLLLQQKNWLYHTIPVSCCALMLFALAAAIAQPVRIRRVVIATGCMAGLMYSLLSVIWIQGYAAQSVPYEALILQNSAPGDSVAILDNSMRPQYPLMLQLHRLPGTRYLWLFQIKFFRYLRERGINSVAGRSLESYEQETARQIEDDISHRHPTLVVVNDGIANELSRWGVLEPLKRRYGYIGNRGGFSVFKREPASGN